MKPRDIGFPSWGDYQQEVEEMFREKAGIGNRNLGSSELSAISRFHYLQIPLEVIERALVEVLSRESSNPHKATDPGSSKTKWLSYYAGAVEDAHRAQQKLGAAKHGWDTYQEAFDPQERLDRLADSIPGTCPGQPKLSQVIRSLGRKYRDEEGAVDFEAVEAALGRLDELLTEACIKVAPEEDRASCEALRASTEEMLLGRGVEPEEASKSSSAFFGRKVRHALQVPAALSLFCP